MSVTSLVVDLAQEVQTNAEQQGGPTITLVYVMAPTLTMYPLILAAMMSDRIF